MLDTDDLDPWGQSVLQFSDPLLLPLPVSDAQECLMGALVVPRFLRGASFHDGDDMTQAGVIATCLNDVSGDSFLADVRLGNLLSRHVPKYDCFNLFGSGSSGSEGGIVSFRIGLVNFEKRPLDRKPAATDTTGQLWRKTKPELVLTAPSVHQRRLHAQSIFRLWRCWSGLP